MKVRESGMPGEEFWESLFDIPGILAGLEIGADFQEVIELGCGYGTFTVPVAQKISGTLHAYDIDRTMAVRTKTRIAAAGLHNVKVNVRDVLDEGFDLPPGSADAVILFNILHTEKPVDLLRLSSRTLRPSGRVLVIHWRSDVATPRGPDLAIRPRPEQVLTWARAAGLRVALAPRVLPLWHYGLALMT